MPWRSIVGLRNWLIHGYVDVDQDVIWSTVVGDLPVLTAELDRMLDETA